MQKRIDLKTRQNAHNSNVSFQNTIWYILTVVIDTLTDAKKETLKEKHNIMCTLALYLIISFNLSDAIYDSVRALFDPLTDTKPSVKSEIKNLQIGRSISRSFNETLYYIFHT